MTTLKSKNYTAVGTHYLPVLLTYTESFVILHRGSEAADWNRGLVAHCSAATGSLTGAHADCGQLVWCLPHPHHFPGWSSLPAVLSGPARSHIEGQCESSLPLRNSANMFNAFKLSVLLTGHIQFSCFIFRKKKTRAWANSVRKHGNAQRKHYQMTADDVRYLLQIPVTTSMTRCANTQQHNKIIIVCISCYWVLF